MPNMTIAQPPSTGVGTAAIRAPSLGNKPISTMIAPAAATTKRLLTLESAIKPVFWVKAL
ncbi:hypothetical protein D3C84_956340 [compost metagenome]